MPLVPTTLDESISPGQAGLITDAQTVHGVINELTSTAGADRVGAAGGGTVQGVFDAALWMRSSDFVAARGAVAVGLLNASLVEQALPAWLFDQTSVEAIAGSFVVPTGWPAVTVTAWFGSSALTTGAVSWLPYYIANVGVGTRAGTGGVTGSVVTTNVGGSTGQIVSSTLLSSVSVTAGTVFQLGIRRDATNVADTLAGDAALVGVRITKG